MIRSQAWKVLGLPEGSSQEKIESRYRELSSLKQQGQQPLVKEAYELLMPNEEGRVPLSVEDTTGSSAGSNRQAAPQRSGGSKWDEFRERWQKAAQRRHARERRENLKHNYDYRDRKSRTIDDEPCMFCGVNRGISKMDALTDGLHWEEYASHPENYRTCWTCKSNHISVMTESMAIQKFAKKLSAPTVKSADGETHRFVFQQLRDKSCAFHHQPRTCHYKEETRISEYFWYPDLEKEALNLGWLPRGKKKEQVPWTRKDLPLEASSSEDDPATYPRTPKKAKTRVAVTP